MKLTLIAITLITSFNIFANTTTYSNQSGCMVEAEQRRNGMVINIKKGQEFEIVGIGNDLSFGDFAYCADEATNISVADNGDETTVTLSCGAHRNGHARTRGTATVVLKADEIQSIQLEGQVKGLFRWKQDSLISCTNLNKVL